MNTAHTLQEGDYRFSYFSLADSDGGVIIDMINGRVKFDWKYVPFGQVPAAFASFVRRTHFRNGRHIDEPPARIVVPRRS